MQVFCRAIIKSANSAEKLDFWYNTVWRLPKYPVFAVLGEGNGDKIIK